MGDPAGDGGAHRHLSHPWERAAIMDFECIQSKIIAWGRGSYGVLHELLAGSFCGTFDERLWADLCEIHRGLCTVYSGVGSVASHDAGLLAVSVRDDIHGCLAGLAHKPRGNGGVGQQPRTAL